jgi:NAD(P)-dependent dehydrogenase (short-subunit alcohol dehydrogenase family)
VEFQAAVNHYTKALAAYDTDIVVVALCPGWVQTEMGGSNAPLTVEESSSDIVRVTKGLKPTDSGTYINRNGPLPY